MKRTNLDYVEDIVDSINTIEKFTKGISFEDFLGDERTFHTVVRMLEVIGEACNKISEELRQEYPEIQWREIISMRNKLIHEYFGVSEKILWKAVQYNIPELKIQMDRLYSQLLEEENKG